MLLGISEKYFKKKKESAFIMRKQTKLVAVLSTAALLALGASMSSFAATGWQEENGTWVYYDKNGDKETEKWEKSGDNWFYLNEDGEMATDAIVEFNDNYYYVDENGSMVANKWVSIENDDYDGDDNTEPTNHWYYFGANGKAYKNTSDKAVFKIVNGKKYLFNDEGQMLYGWVDEDGTRLTEDDAWKTGLYYLGGSNDGAQSVGWVALDIKAEDDEYGEGFSSLNTFDDEDQNRWFYFNSNGKKVYSKDDDFEDAKSINGKKYSFDQYGRMNAEWVVYGSSPSTASQGTPSYTTSWRYYNSPEDGARVSKGWFKVVPDYYLNSGDYDDDSDAWYYADGDGDLVASEIKTISGKKYLFDAKGKMKSGLRFVKLIGTKTVDSIKSNDDDNFPFETEEEFQNNANHWLALGYEAYYFGSGDDGSMKTGKQTISLDGENQTFLLGKSGGRKGAGKTGLDNSKYYVGGLLLAADKEDKYSVVKITKDGNKGADGVVYGDKIELLTTDKFLKETDAVTKATEFDTKKYDEYYDVSSVTGVTYKLVSTAGTVQKNKSKAKDGSDYYYVVKGETITNVFVEN